jgi:molybdopterin-guanine dinucleotide biosynthesis protein B
MRILCLTGHASRQDIGLALVTEARRRGMAVSVLLRAADDFDPDVPGKDSWRHRKAGATEVVLASARARALMSESAEELDAATVAARLGATDILVIDGGSHPEGLDVTVGEDGGIDAPSIGVAASGPAGQLAVMLLEALEAGS